MNTPDKSSIEYATPGEALVDHGIMVLMDDIDSDSVKPVIEWILHENHVRKKKYKELLLMMCSNGGNMEDAFALIDVMRSSQIAIKTVGNPLVLREEQPISKMVEVDELFLP